MYGIIGEVDKFIIGKNIRKFTKYKSSYEEIDEKLQKMKMEIVDNKQNEETLYKIKNNIGVDSVESDRDVVLGIIATHYGTDTGIVKYGELSARDAVSCLLKKPLRYCYLDNNNMIHISKDTPKELIEIRNLESKNKTQKELDTILHLKVRNRLGQELNIPIVAYYEVDEMENSDNSPILFSNLDELAKMQEEIYKKQKIINNLHIAKEEFSNERVNDIHLKKYKTKDKRLAKILKIYERRFLHDNK